MIKEIISAVVLAIMSGSASAEDWRDEPTRLAAAKTINQLAVHCDEIGFDRSPPLDDDAVSAMISAYLSDVPSPDLVFAGWIRERDKIVLYKESGVRATFKRSSAILDAALSDERPEARARAEDLYVQAIIPNLTHGLEQCRLGAVDPFFSKLWRGRESIDFEHLARLMFRDLMYSLEQTINLMKNQ